MKTNFIELFKAGNGACITLENELVTRLEDAAKTIIQLETKDTSSSRTRNMLKQLQAFICTVDPQTNRGVLLIEQNPAYPFKMTESEAFQSMLASFNPLRFAIRETDKMDSLCISIVLYATGVEEMVEKFLGKKVVVNDGKGEFYKLYPKNEQTYGWPECWPCLKSPGVFIIYDKDTKPIYVGETSNIGERLSDFFGYDAESKSCRLLQDGWQRKPDAVQVFEIQDKDERHNLKKYLIEKLQPIDNVYGKR